MKMKKFLVKSIQEGWEKIATELGENAIIIDIKENNGSFEIIAALPEKEKTTEKKDNINLNKENYISKYKREKFTKRFIPVIGGIATGKTTTIAKIASILKFNLNKKIAIASFDFYKIGGFDNLKKFAEIMQIPFYPIKNERDVIAYRDSFDSYEHIIFDTPGNLKKLPEIERLLKFITVSGNAETILTISLDKKENIIRKELEYFSLFNVSHVIFTKFDEIVDKEEIYQVLDIVPFPVSYVCNGLDVPGDIFEFEKLFTKLEVEVL